ncbi:MAG: hypothetical protein WCA01_02660 [Burkholderiales bacterium]
MKDIAATLLRFSVSVLPVTELLILALLIAAAVVYFMFRVAADGSRRSMLRFALGALTVGFVAGLAGMGLGIAFFCSYSLGNLCGLGGVFLTGPLLGGLALAGYLYVWAGRRRLPARGISGRPPAS